MNKFKGLFNKNSNTSTRFNSYQNQFLRTLWNIFHVNQIVETNENLSKMNKDWAETYKDLSDDIYLIWNGAGRIIDLMDKDMIDEHEVSVEYRMLYNKLVDFSILHNYAHIDTECEYADLCEQNIIKE